MISVERIFYKAHEPISIGAGYAPLTRMRKEVVREEGNQLPFIPGSSLSGILRHYAAKFAYNKPEAGGTHRNFIGDAATCPIIQTFGGSLAVTGEDYQGTVSIGDAHILFFPIASPHGTIYTTTREVLEDAFGNESVSIPGISSWEHATIASTTQTQNHHLTLGWFAFDTIHQARITPPMQVDTTKEWQRIASHIAIVSPAIWRILITMCLEQRPRNSIDSETGTVQPGGLFEIEAIPRATIFWNDLVERIPFAKRTNGFPIERQFDRQERLENHGDPLPDGTVWERPLDVVHSGLTYLSYLGVGAGRTVGQGRLHAFARIMTDPWM